MALHRAEGGSWEEDDFTLMQLEAQTTETDEEMMEDLREAGGLITQAIAQDGRRAAVCKARRGKAPTRTAARSARNAARRRQPGTGLDSVGSRRNR